MFQMIPKNMKKEQIEKLDSLQRLENDGRGVSCVRTIITCLRNSQYKDAVTCCITENDKIRNYPPIQKYLIEILPEYKEELESFKKLFGTE